MAGFNDDWVVQPHGDFVTVEDGLATIAGEIRMPLGHFPRRMTVVKLSAGRLAVWSPVSLDDAHMIELEAMGQPAFLIVPGIGHRLDIRAWKKRYAEAAVICAPGAREAVEEAVPVDGVGDVLADDRVTMSTAPGAGDKEAILWVRRAAGTTLVVNDILANVRHPHGIGAQIMARLLGFGVGHPRMPRIGKKLYLEDQSAIAAAFLDWSRMPRLRHLIVSHGDVIDDPAPVLQRAAADLS